MVGWFSRSIKEDVVFFFFHLQLLHLPFLLRRFQLELKFTRRERAIGLFNWGWVSAFLEPTMVPTDTLLGIPMPGSGEHRGTRWDLISYSVRVWEGRGGWLIYSIAKNRSTVRLPCITGTRVIGYPTGHERMGARY